MARCAAALRLYQDPLTRPVVADDAFKFNRPALDALRQINPYNVPISVAEKLETLGIATDEHSLHFHPHAACKALENRMLDEVSHYLPKSEKITLLAVKHEKLNKLRLNPERVVEQAVAFEPTDFIRFRSTPGGLKSAYDPVNTRFAFMGDTLHYLPPSYIADLFSRSPRLQTLLATMVLPAEVLEGMESLHPEIYTVDHKFGVFFFNPSGHGGQSYTHEKWQLQWLKVGKIKWKEPDGSRKVVSVQRVNSTFAHHLFIFQRGDYETPRVRSFECGYNYVKLPKIFLPSDKNLSKPVPTVMASQLMLYAFSIKTVTFRDVAGKVRQLFRKEDLATFPADQLLHLINFIFFISKLQPVTCYEDILSDNVLKRFFRPIFAKLKQIKGWIFGPEQFEKLLSALKWEPVKLIYEVKDVDLNSFFKDNFSSKKHSILSMKKLDDELDEEELDHTSDFTELVRTGFESVLNGELKDAGTTLNKASTPGSLTMVNRLAVEPSETTPSPEAKEKAKIMMEGGSMHDIVQLHPTEDSSDDETSPSGSKDSNGKEIEGEATSGSKVGKDETALKVPGQKLSAADYEEGEWMADEHCPWDMWLPRLRKLGFKGNQVQYYKVPGQVPTFIPPITRTRPDVNKKRVEFPDYVPKKLSDALTAYGRYPIPEKFSKERARSFTSDVKNGRIGAKLKSQDMAWKLVLDRLAEEEPVEKLLTVIHGVGGSGKSMCIQQALKDIPDYSYLVVVPTLVLRGDWREKLPNAHPNCIKTYEMALIHSPPPLIIFDDYGKLPAGYIEAFMNFHANAKYAILTGDSRQSIHHEMNEQAIITHMPGGVHFYEDKCAYYINATHRNRRDLANALNVYSEKEGETIMTMSSARVEKHIPLLVPSDIKKQLYKGMGHDNSYTYAGCQGITAPKIQIVLDDHTILADDSVMYTALSRAVDSIHFVNAGTNTTDFWDKIDATPYLKTFLSLVREKKIAEANPKERQPTEDPLKTHLAVETDAVIYDDKKEEMGEKLSRELYTRHGYTNAIQTENTNIQMFQHQQSKDEALLDATIDYRLKVSTPDENLKQFKIKAPVGDVLFAAYKHAMKLPDKPVEFDRALWLECYQEIEQTYLAKAKNLLTAGKLRQDPDFDWKKIALFLKSQWVKKSDVLAAKTVKYGQTIAAFQQEVVMSFGTMARYLRRMRERTQPSYIMINCEKTPEQIGVWAAKNWDFKNTSYASDFKAFDQSQDGAMLQFELLWAKHYNIPKEMLDAYLSIKTEAYIYKGVLATMRLTGEGPTFDANTACSIAYTHARFDIPEGTAQLYAGDDMLINTVPAQRSSFKTWESLVSLQAKPEYFDQTQKQWGRFCGWMLTPYGIVREPEQLHASWTLARERGVTDTVIDSYALQADHAYRLGDALLDIFNERQIVMHTTYIRQMHQLGATKFTQSWESELPYKDEAHADRHIAALWGHVDRPGEDISDTLELMEREMEGRPTEEFEQNLSTALQKDQRTAEDDTTVYSIDESMDTMWSVPRGMRSNVTLKPLRKKWKDLVDSLGESSNS